MKITILGSGTCVPSLRRNAPGYLLEVGDKKLLIDCGEATSLQLERVKKGLYLEIDYIFFTHTHPDHLSGLIPLIHGINWTPGFERRKELVLVGAAGFSGFYQEKIKPISGGSKGSFPVVVKEIKKELNFGTFMVKSAKTVHSSDSLAYRFEEGATSLVFSGDTDYDKNLVDLSQGADLLLLECSFTDEEKFPGHLTPSECGEIAKKAQAKKLILTHLYPPLSSEQEKLATCKKIFKNTILAEDLMEITL